MNPNQRTSAAASSATPRERSTVVAKTITYEVDSSGNITPTSDVHAKADDSFIVQLASGSTFTGTINVDRDGKDKANQLVGSNQILLGTTYTVQSTAKGHSFIISTGPSPKAGGSNGTLRVGSGGQDDDDGDDDGEDGKGRGTGA